MIEPTPTLTIRPRRTLRDEVREALTRAILQGQLRPGDRIVETRLARQLGLSQGTVREALRELEQLGLVVSSPNRGVRVRPLTQKDLCEVYEMRALIEGYAVRQACQRLTPADLEALDRLVTAMVEAAQTGDLRRFVEYDVEFHRRLCQASGNTLLVRLWSAIHPTHWTYVSTGLLGLPSLHLAERHRAVVTALRTGDPDQAEAAIHRHLLELRERVLSLNSLSLSGGREAQPGEKMDSSPSSG